MLFGSHKDILAKGSQVMHGIKLRDSTGIAVAIPAPDGQAKPAQNVHGYEASSAWLVPDDNQ